MGFPLAEKAASLLVRRSRGNKDKVCNSNRAILSEASVNERH
jgi:hypothetical protein